MLIYPLLWITFAYNEGNKRRSKREEGATEKEGEERGYGGF